MKNNQNTASTAMSVEGIRAAAAQVGALQEQMTFLSPLTEAERREHQSARIGLKALRRIENRLVAAREHRELLPAAFDLRKFERDATTAGALGECLAVIDKLRGAVYDTLLAVGKRASVAANNAYGHIKVGSTTAEQLKRTVDKLGRRGGRTPATSATETPVARPATAPPGPTPPEPAVRPAPAAKVESPTEPINKAA
jgi:hypothetical protein